MLLSGLPADISEEFDVFVRQRAELGRVGVRLLGG